MNLALFDFDGTITHRDTFTDFLYFAAARKRLMIGKIILAPVILGYKAGIVSTGKARKIVAGYGFRGRVAADIYALGRKYANHILPNYLRPEAMQRIQWHKEQGDRIVLVSASLDLYLKYWCATHALDLICSTLEVQKGVFTGKYQCRDCSGMEKARRINESYALDQYPVIYAYGDTMEDNEMLALAHIKFFQGREMGN